PADHVVPQVDHQRQVPVGLHPLGEVVVDDRFRRRSHHQRLRKLLPTAVRDHGQLGGEALDVLLLLLQEAHGDEQRERDVLRARRLDPAVHVRLHELPDGVPPRSDDHGSPRRAVVGQFGARNDVLVPGGEVLRLRGEYGLLHGVTVAAVATGYPGFRTVSNDSPDRGHPGRSAAGGPASTTAPPLHHSVGTGWYDRRRHPDHGYEIDRVDGSGVPPPRRNTPLVPDAEPLTGKAESGGGAHPRRPAHRPQDDQLERAGRQLRRGPRPRPAP